MLLYPEPKHGNETLMNIYLKHLNSRKNKKIQECILMGDFNARHTFWGDHRNNEAGLSWFIFLPTNQLHVLNSNKPTFTSTNGRSSVIDLFISAGKLSNFTVSTAIDYHTELGSDAPERGHYPVLLYLASDRTSVQTTQQQKWNWDKTNWNIFTQSL